MALLLERTWRLVDDGPQSGDANMAADLSALEQMNAGTDLQPVLRFFQWRRPSVSYGYLMDPVKVKQWMSLDGVQRPTGGGAVFHQTGDLSLSLLWPRQSGFLPDKPRACYQAIHEKLQAALKKWSGFSTALHVSCEKAPRSQTGISICFNEPVCNDVMMGGKKMIGGALRVTRGAVLYQGNILLDEMADPSGLKTAIAAEFI